MVDAGPGPKPEAPSLRLATTGAGGCQDLRVLAQAASCSDADLQLFSIALTHESALAGAPYELEAARSLQEHLRGIGAHAVATSVVDYFLRDQELADVNHVEKRLQAVETGLYDAVASRFGVMRFAEIGGGPRQRREILPGRFASPTAEASFPRRRSRVEKNMLKRFVGAMYLSSSYENVKRVAAAAIAECEGAAAQSTFDAKTVLLEFAQHRWRCCPVYTVVDASGPEHHRVFTCRVAVGRQFADGTGLTKKAAGQDAAREFLNSLPRDPKLLEISKNFLVLAPEQHETRPLRSASLRPAPAAIREAKMLAPKMGFDGVDIVQLAVALTLPGAQRSGFDTNVRHAFLGASLERLLFRVYAQQAIPGHITRWAGVPLFESQLCNASARAQLFDVLGCRPVTGVRGPLPLTSKADAIDAIAAAVYLSCTRFSDFFRWAVDILGDCLRDRIMELCSNPARLKDPKSLLQELSQAALAFTPKYTSTAQGPAHGALFTTSVHAIDERQQRTLLGVGTAPSRRDSELMAASNGAKVLTPTRSGAPLCHLAVTVWRRILDAALKRDGHILAVCGIDHFRALNAFDSYFELKAFAMCLPSLAETLTRPEFVRAMVRSIGHLAPFGIRDLHNLAMAGIDLVTSVPPDECHRLFAGDLDGWLGSFRRAANSIKLPAEPVSRPSNLLKVSELAAALRLEKASLRVVRDSEISEAHFSHVATLLERMDDFAEAPCTATLIAEGAPESSRCTISFPPTWLGRFQIAQVLGALTPHAFFSGVVDSFSQSPDALSVDTRGVIPEPVSSYSRAYTAIIQTLFEQQNYIHTLYRVTHDLKNRVLTIREMARTAEADALTRYQSLAAVERLQQQIRQLKVSLATYFAALESDTAKTCDVLQLFRAFVQQELSSLPVNIQTKIESSIEPAVVDADPELLRSLLSNLSRNAIEAMPAGGMLSVSATYSKGDIFLLEVADTGCGIPESRLADVLSGMQSTKKGMGLGLATVGRIVEIYKGTIKINSVLQKGTTVLVGLPLRAACASNERS